MTVRDRYKGSRRAFRAAYVGLALILLGSLGAFAFLLARPGAGEGAPWSSWRPTKQGVAGAQEVAKFVARQYRLPTDRQLVGVLARRPELQQGAEQESIPISAIALQSATGADEGDISFVETKNSVMYILCGLGDGCSIPGKPTQARGRLVRREALELALYTFKYIEGVESVLTLIPPPSGEQPQTTLFFRRSELKRQLERPLAETLKPRQELVAGSPMPDPLVVDRLTLPRLFQYEFRSGVDGAIMVLAPPPL